jgi:hypothetical protein
MPGLTDDAAASAGCRLAADAFGADSLRQVIIAPRILHFEGPALAKPWHSPCDHPWRDYHSATLARPPWAAIPVWDRTIATRLIARLPRRRRLSAFVRLLPSRARLHHVRSRAPR